MGLRKLVKHVRDVMFAVLAGDGELTGIVLSAQHMGEGLDAQERAFGHRCFDDDLPLSMIMMRVQISSTSSM